MIPTTVLLVLLVRVSLMEAVDIFFIFRQRSLFIFKHWMPESFTCSEFPCNHGRDTPTTCYVNRSTEKSIIINLHLLVVVLGKTLKFKNPPILAYNSKVLFSTLWNCIRLVSIKLSVHGIEKIRTGLNNYC